MPSVPCPGHRATGPVWMLADIRRSPDGAGVSRWAARRVPVGPPSEWNVPAECEQFLTGGAVALRDGGLPDRGLVADLLGEHHVAALAPGLGVSPIWSSTPTTSPTTPPASRRPLSYTPSSTLPRRKGPSGPDTGGPQKRIGRHTSTVFLKEDCLPTGGPGQKSGPGREPLGPRPGPVGSCAGPGHGVG